MELNMYSIYDRLAESYANPFVLNPKVAQRTWNWLAKDYNEQDVQDKEVRQIAVWDNETGQITPIVPVTVADLQKLKESMENGH